MSSDEAPPEEAPLPPPPEPEPLTPAERRAERLFRIEIVKTVFSILATIGSVLAIFFTYASSDFKDNRASLDSIEARLGESTGFRQAAAAAMLPHYYRYQSVWGEYPFREEIQALLSSYFATVATHERGDDLVPPTRAYPVDRGDLRDEPGV